MSGTLDNGKPIRETRNIDILLAVNHLRYFASVPEAEEGNTVILDKRYLSFILRGPIGVAD